MKILVIDKSVFRGKISDRSSPLFRHLLLWQKGNNEIDLMARVEKDVENGLKGKLNLIKLPPKLFFLSTYYAYYYLIFKSKKYDLIIEVWRDKPTFRLIYNSKRSLVFVLGNNFKNILPKKIFKLLYRRNKFLISSPNVQDKLAQLGVKESNIICIPDGIDGKKSSKKGRKKKQKFLIICGKDVNSTVSLVSLIERRSLDWKFIVLTDKKYISKLKSEYEKVILNSSVKTMSRSDYNFDKNISDSKYLIITKDVGKVTDYITGAFFVETPVFVEEASKTISDKNLLNLVLDYGNNIEVASKLFDLSKSEVEYKNLQHKISKSIQFHTWDEVGEQSLKIIESL